jgi:hypothetical protein
MMKLSPTQNKATLAVAESNGPSGLIDETTSAIPVEVARLVAQEKGYSLKKAIYPDI